MLGESPDDQRERSGAGAGIAQPREPSPPAAESARVATKAEGGLGSEKGALQEQARQAKPLGDVENLLDPPNELKTGT